MWTGSGAVAPREGARALMEPGFNWLDWSVVALVLIATTVVGERMAGKQASMRDFFLGGRKLPWYAVSASIVATEISAVTYISLPSVVFRDGGNITYLQLGLIGSFLARVFIGYVLVPAYYEREVYSPYDYMGRRLGAGAREVATVLFSLGGVLAQSARVYLTAIVLEVILHDELAWIARHTGLSPLVTAVAAIGVIAVLWTWMGGIATVVWTDSILFVLFLVGICVALFTVSQHLDAGLGAAFADGWRADKFRFFDGSTDPTEAYTIWAACFAASWGGIGSYGTDQLLAQRLFCCRDQREARKAIIASIAAMAVTFLVALVGVGLWAYYREHPMRGETLALYSEKNDRVFPLFITHVIPNGLKGLVIAGAFAAAISSLDSIMAALTQTSLSALYLPRRRQVLLGSGRDPDGPEEGRRMVRLSRVVVLVWGLLLCAMAVVMDLVARSSQLGSILDLALAMAGYTGGALVAGFFLAFLRLPIDGSGFGWASALSVMTVFAVVWHDGWAQQACSGFAILVGVLWIARRGSEWLRDPAGMTLRTAALALGLVGVGWLSRHGTFEGGRVLAWPWYIPVGSVVAFSFGWLLARPASQAAV